MCERLQSKHPSKTNRREELTMNLEDVRGHHRIKVTKGCQGQLGTHPSSQDVGRLLLMPPSKVIPREADKPSINVRVKTEGKKAWPANTSKHSKDLSLPTLQRKGGGSPFSETSSGQTLKRGKSFSRKLGRSWAWWPRIKS